MNPYLSDPDLTVYNGDALETLRELPAESVHMCVTSPPFFGLRDYGNEGQIGLEPTPEAWVKSLVAVIEEVRRVLRKDGTLWVECGDSYAGSRGAQSRENGTGQDSLSAGQITAHPKATRTGSIPPGATFKPKDLIGQPFLLAFALRDAGWYWRNVCIWHKPNPMPESCKDRFTVSHSYVLLFSKSPRYFFDAEAVRENYEGFDGRTKTTISGAGQNGHENYGNREGNDRWPGTGRNARSVWTIATEPLPFEHYAAFPQALAERCIKAGTSERGCCPECGAPWVREVEREQLRVGYVPHSQQFNEKGTTRVSERKSLPRHLRTDASKSGWGTGGGKTTGWIPTCRCAWAVGPEEFTPIPCTVLDPFMGSGTTALVARRLNRCCIGIELNPKYCELIARRTQQLSLEAVG